MRFVLAAGMLLVGQPAFANWQFTKWGMTPQQVLEASGGQAVIVIPGPWPDENVRNRGPYRSGEYEFIAKFRYTDEKLTSVLLTMDGACGALKGDLIGLYGNKYETVGIPGLAQTYFWKDYKKGNNISYLDFGSQCVVTYSKIDRTTRDGL